MADESWTLHDPVYHNSDGSDLSASSENPLDWACDELKGRATGIFLPLEEEDVLVQEGIYICTHRSAMSSDPVKHLFVFR